MKRSNNNGNNIPAIEFNESATAHVKEQGTKTVTLDNTTPNGNSRSSDNNNNDNSNDNNIPATPIACCNVQSRQYALC